MAGTNKHSIRLAALVALMLAVLAAAAPRAGASATDVIRDCSEDGVLDGKYSQSEIKKALQQKLGRAVELTLAVDASLIGGAIIQADDMVIDGSVRTRLQRLTEKIVG